MSLRPPDPDTMEGAYTRLGDALAALWWELVYVTRLDTVVMCLARKLGEREDIPADAIEMHESEET